jgi:L-lysine exporter family protein LysE/ArgO
MVMSIMLGTVFFALIQNSIDYGFKSGIYIASGVIVSDIILIGISIFGASLIPEGGATEYIIRGVGAVFLLGYGINNLRVRKQVHFPETKGGQLFHFLSLGFILNIINPANLFWWIAVSANLQAVAEYTWWQSGMFYTGALAGIFSVETLIAFLANKLKLLITPKLLRNIDRVVGVLFIGFSIALVWPALRALVGMYW